jgi:hypothetical protein
LGIFLLGGFMECLVGLDFIRSRLSGELLEVLALSLELCLSCGGKLVSRDGEVVCSRCGLVWSVENSADHVPFPEHESSEVDDGGHYEGHWQPGNTLAFLKGLGDPALANSRGKGKALMRVLAKSPNGAEDLGLRARQVKTLVEWEDPPQLRKVLSRISLLLTLTGQRDNWLLADYTGNLARKIVAFKLLTGQMVRANVGDAVVVYAVEKFGLKVKPQGLEVDADDLELARMLDKLKERRNPHAKKAELPPILEIQPK